ncbi:hypothetical protein Tco_1493861 [Tanacetum coccineum]
MLVEMIAQRKSSLQHKEQQSKETQIRNRMCTYLKNMSGYRHNPLKGRSYEEIQKLFDKACKQVNSFIPMDSEVLKSSETRTKGSSKRARDKLESNKSKNSKRYLSMIKMLQNIDREDLEILWKLVKAKHRNTRPEEDYERVFWGDLKVMFEPDIRSEVWRSLQGYKVTIWKFFDTYEVHFVRSIQVGSTIRDKKGAENLTADHLSRLENPDLGKLTKAKIKDLFPEEQLMAISDKKNEPCVLTESYKDAWPKIRQHKFFDNVTTDHLKDIMASPPPQGKSLRPSFTGHISYKMHLSWYKFAMHVNEQETSHQGTKHLKNTSKSMKYSMFGELTLWDLSPH